MEKLNGLRWKNAERQLELIEALQLGGKRQIMLINCGGQRYLVGVGAESVQAIVPVAEQDRRAVGRTAMASWEDEI